MSIPVPNSVRQAVRDLGLLQCPGVLRMIMGKQECDSRAGRYSYIQEVWRVLVGLIGEMCQSLCHDLLVALQPCTCMTPSHAPLPTPSSQPIRPAGSSARRPIRPAGSSASRRRYSAHGRRRRRCGSPMGASESQPGITAALPPALSRGLRLCPGLGLPLPR